MIHAAPIMDILGEQVNLTENVPEDANGEYIPSYLLNMGLCPDCVLMVADLYCLAVAEENEEVIDHKKVATFVRAFTVGVMVGRTYPKVTG